MARSRFAWVGVGGGVSPDAEGTITVEPTIAENPSICAPSWILTSCPVLRVLEASSVSVDKGEYGVTISAGETVVGNAIPLCRALC